MLLSEESVSSTTVTETADQSQEKKNLSLPHTLHKMINSKYESKT